MNVPKCCFQWQMARKATQFKSKIGSSPKYKLLQRFWWNKCTNPQISIPGWSKALLNPFSHFMILQLELIIFRSTLLECNHVYAVNPAPLLRTNFTETLQKNAHSWSKCFPSGCWITTNRYRQKQMQEAICTTVQKTVLSVFLKERLEYANSKALKWCTSMEQLERFVGMAKFKTVFNQSYGPNHGAVPVNW